MNQKKHLLTANPPSYLLSLPSKYLSNNLGNFSVIPFLELFARELKNSNLIKKDKNDKVSNKG